MLLFRRISSLLVFLTLAACGFAPVYGTGGTGSRLQNNIEVSEPDTLEGHLLTRRIEERLGRTVNPAYKLVVMISTSQAGLGVNSAGTTTRFNLLGNVNFSVIDTKSGSVVMSGFVDNFTGYSTTGTTLATQASARDAQERLMILLADQITTRVLSANLP